jgi:hypothetical protein
LTLTAAVPFVLVECAFATADVLFESVTVVSLLAGAAAYLLGTAAMSVIYGAVVEAVDAARHGGVAARYGRTLSSWGALAGTGLVITLAVFAGLILFVAPGLIVLTRWSLAPQVVVLERCSWRQALSRSSQLVAGHGWRVLGWVGVTGSAYLGIYFSLDVLLASMPAWPRGWLSGYAVDVVLFPILAVVWTVVYYRLPRAGDSAPESLAAT